MTRPGMRDRATVGAQARAAQPGRQARSQGGRPPIWPAGTEVVRLNMRWPAEAVRRLREKALAEGRDPSLILYDLAAHLL